MRQANATNLVIFRALLSYKFVLHRLVFVGVKRSSHNEVMFRKLHELGTFFNMHDTSTMLCVCACERNRACAYDLNMHDQFQKHVRACVIVRIHVTARRI